jgi:hypothetical protein
MNNNTITQGTILRHKDALGNAFYLTVEETGYFSPSNTNGFSARADDGTLHVFYAGDEKYMEVISTPNPDANPDCSSCFGSGTVAGRHGSSYTCSCVVLRTAVKEDSVIDGLTFHEWLGGAA